MLIPLPKRLLAHAIILDGRRYAMSVAELSADGKTVSIHPFEREEAGTVFVSGEVEIILGQSGFAYEPLSSTPA